MELSLLHREVGMSLLGSAVRDARLGAGFHAGSEGGWKELSVRELGRLTGISHTQISRIESGEVTSPSADLLTALARGLQRKPAPLLIVAGRISGDDARAELVGLFHAGAELADVWGDWAHRPWEDACRLVRDESATPEQIAELAYDVFVAGETFETLWEGEELLVPQGPGQSDLRRLLNIWYFLPENRRAELLNYSSTLRRVQELDELAEMEEIRQDAAQIPTSVSPNAPGAFSEDFLTNQGFEGFVRLAAVPGGQSVPASPGVYAVIRRSDQPPSFLGRSVGGHFKGEDPTVPVERLQHEWVRDSTTLYIGRASNLRGRITLLARFGAGAPVAHRGGRLLWQLADHEDLLIAWLETPDQLNHEAELVREFENTFGALPFANLNRPGGAA